MIKNNILFFSYFIFVLIKFILCYETNKRKNIKNSFNIENNYIRDSFIPEIINRTINVGKVQNELLNDNIYKFGFENNYNNNILIHFYPLDSQILIEPINEDNDNEGISIQKISNYDYNAYSILIEKGKTKNSYIKIKPLINQLDHRNKIRTYHLIINSFENIETPQLYLNAKKPTLLYFDELNLKNIKLSYKLNTLDVNTEDPIIFSFFIKERTKFNIEVLDNNMENKTIDYIDNIIIYPNYFLNANFEISVLITKYDCKNSTMIVKVTGNYNTSASYLQKNIINFGFMPINITNQYYYMEVFKDEEGEILLHNKRQNGILIAKIIQKENLTENQIINDTNNFPDLIGIKDNNYLEFNEFSQKLTFNSNKTNMCEKGCFLLLNYYSPLFDIKNIDGIEFTLLIEIWDEGEYTPQIINIPLKEYIFGTFESKSIKAYYYSIFFPEDNNAIIEIQGTSDIRVYAKSGIKKINVLNPENSVSFVEEYENDNLKLIIDLKEKGFQNLKNQYITLAFTTIDNGELLPNYYFRIIQQNENKDYIIYPLDSNKVNICKTQKTNQDNNNTCYFLIKNNYKELRSLVFAYSYGIKEVNYYYGIIKQKDLYSIDLNKTTYINQWTDGYMLISPKNITKESDFIILKITSNYEEILNVLFNFYDPIKNISLNIYSYQIFHLKNDSSSEINFNRVSNYRIFINVTRGNGNLYFNRDYENKTIISQKMFYSFYISEELNSIQLQSVLNLIFLIKINNQINNGIIEEINIGTNIRKIVNHAFPIIYYIKDTSNKGININFNFDFYNDINENNLLIFGCEIDYNIIKKLGTSFDIYSLIEKYDINVIYGKYDDYSKNGLLILDNRNNTNIIKNIYDNYYLIVIDDSNFEKEVSDFSFEMNVNPIDENQYILPLDKYIKGYFPLLNENNNLFQTYNISLDLIRKRSFFILEFSTNYKDIELYINEEINFTSIYDVGFGQFLIKFKDTTKDFYNFIVKVIDSTDEGNKEKKTLNDCNYILGLFDPLNYEYLNFSYNGSYTFVKINNNETGNKYSYNLTLKNKILNSNENFTENFTCIYYLRIFSKKKLYKNEILNTTAQISSEMELSMKQIEEPNKEIFFILNDLPENEDFIASFFINIKNSKGKNKYYSFAFNITTKEEIFQNNESNNKHYHKLIFILYICLGVFVIILLIILISFCNILKNKNRELRERIRSVSFSSGIIENGNEKDNKDSKSEEDYEATFI